MVFLFMQSIELPGALDQPLTSILDLVGGFAFRISETLKKRPLTGRVPDIQGSRIEGQEWVGFGQPPNERVFL